jgi:hypothetical protein
MIEGSRAGAYVSNENASTCTYTLQGAGVTVRTLSIPSNGSKLLMVWYFKNIILISDNDLD